MSGNLQARSGREVNLNFLELNMAFPTVSAPYGLKPINLIGGQVFAGQTRELPIASNTAGAINNGDIVRLSSGFIVKETGTTTVSATGVVGVFVGCSYTNPSTGQILFANSYPGSVVASDIVAYVVDDPDALFKVAVTGGATSTTITPIDNTILGNNLAISQPAANTTISGNSNIGAFDSGSNTAFTLPLRVVGLVEETVDASGNYSEVIVKWNMPYITLTEGAPNVVAYNGGHSYYNPTGTANV
jgi:hypothetical protein